MSATSPVVELEGQAASSAARERHLATVLAFALCLAVGGALVARDGPAETAPRVPPLTLPAGTTDVVLFTFPASAVPYDPGPRPLDAGARLHPGAWRRHLDDHLDRARHGLLADLEDPHRPGSGSSRRHAALEGRLHGPTNAFGYVLWGCSRGIGESACKLARYVHSVETGFHFFVSDLSAGVRSGSEEALPESWRSEP